MNAISLDGIRKSYFGKRVLDDISLQLAPGHFYALLGRNGAGKSTLMRVISRQEAPDAGRGAVMGFDIEDDPSDFFNVVGFSSESTGFFYVRGPVRRRIEELQPFYPGWDNALFEKLVADFGLDLNVQFGSMSHGLVRARFFRDKRYIPAVISNLQRYPDLGKYEALRTISILTGEHRGLDFYADLRRGAAPKDLRLASFDCAELKAKTIDSLKPGDEGALNVCLHDAVKSLGQKETWNLESFGWFRIPLSPASKAYVHGKLGMK